MVPRSSFLPLVAALALASAQHLQLPNLPYDYDALEPHMDTATMKLHHLVHHKTYTDKLNEALAALKARDDTKPLVKTGIDNILFHLNELPDPYGKQVRNHGGGFVNHELFFFQFAPESLRMSFGAETPLGAAIATQFGSYELFFTAFKAASAGLFGSGWTWLESDANGNLTITTTPNQDSPLFQPGRYPIIACDLWEHAYYKLYGPKRMDYLDNFFAVLDWRTLDARYAKARASAARKEGENSKREL